jgi:hypothetical protein
MVGIEALIPMLVKMGAKIGFALQLNELDKAIRFLAVCGPIQIPIDLTYEKAREIGQGLLDAAEKFDPQKPVEAAEAVTALKGDYDDDAYLGYACIDPSRIIQLP